MLKGESVKKRKRFGQRLFKAYLADPSPCGNVACGEAAAERAKGKQNSGRRLQLAVGRCDGANPQGPSKWDPAAILYLTVLTVSNYRLASITSIHH